MGQQRKGNQSHPQVPHPMKSGRQGSKCRENNCRNSWITMIYSERKTSTDMGQYRSNFCEDKVMVRGVNDRRML